MVVPVHPFQGRHLNSFAALPRLAVNQLGLVQPVDGFGQGVVVAIALATNRGLDAGLGQSLGVADRDVLAATIAVVDQTPVRCGWRAYSACSRASSTKSVFMLVLTRQPTIRRANTSITKATYSQPCQVET